MRSVRPHEVALLLSASMASSDSHVVAGVLVDGVHYLCRLELDKVEEERRRDYGLGPVLDTGILHAIWPLQSAGTAIAQLPTRDIETLEQCDPGLIYFGNGAVTRLYEPIGEVDLVAAWRSRPELAVTRALAMPPIFQRVAMWRREVRETAAETSLAIERGRRDGIGLIECDDEAARVVCHPRSAVPGVPAVYRWLIAELTYESWLQAQSAQAWS